MSPSFQSKCHPIFISKAQAVQQFQHQQAATKTTIGTSTIPRYAPVSAICQKRKVLTSLFCSHLLISLTQTYFCSIFHLWIYVSLFPLNQLISGGPKAIIFSHHFQLLEHHDRDGCRVLTLGLLASRYGAGTWNCIRQFSDIILHM